MWFSSWFLKSGSTLAPLAARWPMLQKIIGVLFLAAALPGCSAIKVAYNQAPELAYWYLDDYVDFSSAQSLQVKAELASLQAWHRQTQLPAYAALLQSVQPQLASDISPAQACKVFADVQQKLKLLAERTEPVVASLATTLDAAQLQTMDKQFAKSNASYRDDHMDDQPQAIGKRRVNDGIKRAEMLYGRITSQQTELIARMVENSAFDAERAYAERVRRQKDMLQTLQRMASTTSGAAPATTSPAATEPARTAAKGLMERMLSSPDAAYRSYAARLLDNACQRFAEFHNTTTPAQRSKAVETVASYEKDLRALAAAAGQ